MSAFFSKLTQKLTEATKEIQAKIMHKSAGPVGQADLEDSNVAGIGSDEDRAARKAAAETEPAWEGAGSEVGIIVWRIEAFEVKRVDEADYGSFYSGDSYIVLHTREEDDQLVWDIHFWLGEETSVDEMGTAAYKTVELDNLLDDAAVQHREVQNHESAAFLKLFKPAIRVMAGGIDSGFHHVEPESYTPRLLHVKKTGKQTRVSQVPLVAASLNHHDVFVLDAGLKLFMFEGDLASGFEKHKGGDVMAAIRSDRDGQPEICDALTDEFWSFFEGGEGEISSDDHAPADPSPDPSLWRLSDDSGELSFAKVADAPLSKDMLDSADTFIVDTGSEIFIWIGADASYAERYNAMPHAMQYLTDQNRPSFLPITRLVEGGETSAFNAVF